MSEEAIHREELRLARQLARAAHGVCMSTRPDNRSHGMNMIVGSSAVEELQEALEALDTFYRSTLPDAPTGKQPYTLQAGTCPAWFPLLLSPITCVNASTITPGQYEGF